MTRGRRALVSWIATAAGVALFAASLARVDLHALTKNPSRIALALLLSLAASGMWHAVRTLAWRTCFNESERVSFARLARVRLAAEAFSFLTWSGVTGEPLKVILLGEEVSPRSAVKAIAVDRLVFVAVTFAIVCAASAAAWTAPTLSQGRARLFIAFAIVAGVIASGAIAGVRRFARGALDFRRAAALTALSIAAYTSLCAEAWMILRLAGVPISFLDAVVIETIARVASIASSFIPANLGALEATSLAAAAAVGASGGGAPLAIVRRLRGLFWAGAGLVGGARFASPAGSRRSRWFQAFQGSGSAGS